MATLAQTIKSIPIEKSDYNWKPEKEKILPHSMQTMCSRVCSFPFALPSFFIKKFTKENDVVLDPWSGKATVPAEALRNNRVGIGNDKSPEAFVLTHAKVRPVNLKSLQKFLVATKRKMDSIQFHKNLSELDKMAKIFYSKKTFEQILKLREVLKNENSDVAIFTKAVVLGILHGSSADSLSLSCSHSYSMSPNYVKKYAREHSLRRPSKDVLRCVLNKAVQLLQDPLPEIKGIALNDDSRKLSLTSESVDMILTSPPYFGVQTYAWSNWLRLWFLGYDHREIRKLLEESDSESKYKDFMEASSKELYRVLKPNGKCFIVVGDVTKQTATGKMTVNTAEFILPSLLDVGFSLETIIVDTIPSHKRVMSYIPEDSGIKTERILCLRK